MGREMRRHEHLGSLWRRRSDPTMATGLALTLALGLIFVAGVGLGVLSYLVRTDSGLLGVDSSVADWGAEHATAWSTDALETLTHLGDTVTVIVLGIVLVVAETIRAPSRWLAPFVVVVILGQNLITNGLKEVFDRLRPTINPIAETLGPSFPSGHSATAAAFYAAAALVLGRRRPALTRALLAGGAVAIAVLVAGTRVMLGVHWLTDVIGGLLLGWAWFAVAAIAFGGRLLRFGAATEHATDAATGRHTESARDVAAEVEPRPDRSSA
jgi:undecaprenyl-diphosphatase